MFTSEHFPQRAIVDEKLCGTIRTTQPKRPPADTLSTDDPRWGEIVRRANELKAAVAELAVGAVELPAPAVAVDADRN